jgi:RHS repeat-associated protein
MRSHQTVRTHGWLGRAVVVLCLSLFSVPVWAQTPTETTEYYGLDAIGSVRIVFDSSGTVLARLDYEPFGREVSSSANAPAWKFAGLFRDGEAGLDHAGARSYQSRTGRFSTVDPVYAGLFEPQKWNRYAYALNSPLKYVDPTGLDGCTFLNGNVYCDVSVKPVTTSMSVTGIVAIALTSIGTDPLAKPGYTGPRWGDILATRTAPGIVLSDIKELVSSDASIGERVIAAAGLPIKNSPVGRIVGGIAPVLKGQAGVRRAIASIEAEGGKVLGREVTIQVGAGRVRMDLLIRNAQGGLEFVEVKSGARAALNPNQARLFPQIQQLGGIPRGVNAEIPGGVMTPGVPIGPTPVRVIRYP